MLSDLLGATYSRRKESEVRSAAETRGMGAAISPWTSEVRPAHRSVAMMISKCASAAVAAAAA